MIIIFGNAINDITSATNLVKQNPDWKMIQIPGNYFRSFAFNCMGSTDDKYNTDMQKAEVRQAMNLIIDKEAVASFYKGQAVPLTTLINPKNPKYNTSIPLWKRDVVKAKEMLTAAGFDFDRPIRLLYYYDDQTTADIMELLKQNFAEAGVTLEPFLDTTDEGIYVRKNWDIMYMGGSAGDPILLYTQLAPDGGAWDGLLGNIELRQQLFGDPLNKYTGSLDSNEQKTIAEQVQVNNIDYCFRIPVYGLNQIVAYNTGKLKLDESMFTVDMLIWQGDMMWDKWELIK